MGLSDIASCECGIEEQTLAHILQTCPHLKEKHSSIPNYGDTPTTYKGWSSSSPSQDWGFETAMKKKRQTDKQKQTGERERQTDREKKREKEKVIVREREREKGGGGGGGKRKRESIQNNEQVSRAYLMSEFLSSVEVEGFWLTRGHPLPARALNVRHVVVLLAGDLSLPWQACRQDAINHSVTAVHVWSLSHYGIFWATCRYTISFLCNHTYCLLVTGKRNSNKQTNTKNIIYFSFHVLLSSGNSCKINSLNNII